MAVWTVWEHDKFGARKAERARLVRDGFSWGALVFGSLWLAWNGMWLLFVALTVGAVALIGVVSLALSPDVATVVAVGLHVWFGFEARGLRRWSLAGRGWTLTGIVEARKRRTAERRYFEDRLAELAEPGTPEVGATRSLAGGAA